MDLIWNQIIELCEKLSNTTYENLSKIIRLEAAGSGQKAKQLDDSMQNDLEFWMGGGTCFSMTWFLYQSLLDLGLKATLIMGHKKNHRNTHCALILTYQRKEYFLDPGYLIFDPLEIPRLENPNSMFPLRPNSVQLTRTKDSLFLYTGSFQAPMKLRFEFDLAGVSLLDYNRYWEESFYKEMMEYPVLNRLDKKNGIQYYYQKGNLVTRTGEGSKIQKIEEDQQVRVLSELFHLKPEIVEKALLILKN
ncbi:MAG: hypothetical protein GX116_05645 [Fibrobacter sp.]|jgi:arylamine N-acetyltransferase|nr:hypothetical protein [Fibrobacter sp.]